MKVIDFAGIREALARTALAIAEEPDKAKAKNPPATAVLQGGLACRVTGSGAEIQTDMPRGVGGGAAAPTPGWYLRAALAACDATCIAMEAAKRNIQLTRLEVSVDSETDNRGLLGLDDSITPGMTNLRLQVRISGVDVTESALHELVQAALPRSPVGCTDASSATVEVEIA